MTITSLSPSSSFSTCPFHSHRSILSTSTPDSLNTRYPHDCIPRDLSPYSIRFISEIFSFSHDKNVCSVPCQVSISHLGSCCWRYLEQLSPILEALFFLQEIEQQLFSRLRLRTSTFLLSSMTCPLCRHIPPFSISILSSCQKDLSEHREEERMETESVLHFSVENFGSHGVHPVFLYTAWLSACDVPWERGFSQPIFLSNLLKVRLVLLLFKQFVYIYSCSTF